MDLRHIKLDFKPKRPPAKTPADYKAEYRNSLKKDPQQWLIYQEKQRGYEKAYLNSLSAEQEQARRERRSESQRKRRKRQKEAKKATEAATTAQEETDFRPTSSKKETRQSLAEKRHYWRMSKQRQRSQKTQQELSAIYKRDNDRRRDRKNAPATPLDTVTVPTTTSTATMTVPPGPSTTETVPPGPSTTETVPITPSTPETVPITPSTTETVPITPSTTETVPITPSTTETVPITPSTTETVPSTTLTTMTIPTGPPTTENSIPAADNTPNPSPTKDAKYGALKRVRKCLPNSKKAKLYVVQQLMKSFSPNTKKCIVESSGITLESKEKNRTKRVRAGKVMSEVKAKAVDFHESVAIDLPDKRYFSKRLNMQRKVLHKSISAYYKEFIRKNPSIKISKRSFYRSRPRHILKQKSIKLRQCLCEICENLHLMSTSLVTAGSPYKSVRDAMLCTLCPFEGDFPSLECVERNCSNCGVGDLQLELFSKCSVDNTVCYKRWESVEDAKCKGKKTKQVIKSCTVRDLIFSFCSNISDFALHNFVDRWQRSQFNSLKASLDPNCALLVADFAENYTCQHQDQAQSAYYGLDQVTIHPVVVYAYCKKCAKKHTYYRIYVSDDTKHDSHFVYYVLHDTLHSMGESFRFVIFSDNCGAQYKSRLPVHHIGKLSKLFSIERAFFGERHGKSECDSIGGVVKSYLSQAVVSGQATLTNATEIVTFLKSNFQLRDEVCLSLKRTFHEVKTCDVDRSVSSFEVPPLKGIKKVHSFKFPSDHVIAIRSISCFCNYCLNGHHDECINVPAFTEKSFGKEGKQSKAVRKKRRKVSEANKGVVPVKGCIERTAVGHDGGLMTMTDLCDGGLEIVTDRDGGGGLEIVTERDGGGGLEIVIERDGGGGLEIVTDRDGGGGLEIVTERDGGLEIVTDRDGGGGLEIVTERDGGGGLEIVIERDGGGGLEIVTDRDGGGGLEIVTERDGGLEIVTDRDGGGGLEIVTERDGGGGLEIVTERDGGGGLEIVTDRDGGGGLEIVTDRDGGGGLEIVKERDGGLEIVTDRDGGGGLEIVKERGGGLEIVTERGDGGGLEIVTERDGGDGLEIVTERDGGGGLEIVTERDGGGGLEIVTERGDGGGLEIVTERDGGGGLEIVTERDGGGGLEIVTERDGGGGLEIVTERGDGGGLEIVTERDGGGGLEIVTERGDGGGLEIVTERDGGGGLEIVTERDGGGGLEIVTERDGGNLGMKISDLGGNGEMDIKVSKNKDRAKSARRKLIFKTVQNSGRYVVRGPGFKDFYMRLSKCNSFHDLVDVCSEVDFEPLVIRPVLSKVVPDFVAYNLIKSNCPNGYLPHVTLADGNCVPRSLSILVYGNESRHVEMRCRIVRELVMNKNLYLDGKFLALGCYIAEDEILSRIAQLSDSLGARNFLDPNDMMYIFESEVFDTRLLGTFLGPWHLHAAAQLMNCAIVSLYPSIGPPQYLQLLSRAFVPSGDDYPEQPLFVAWTSNRDGMKHDHWVANHVVPLVKLHKV